MSRVILLATRNAGKVREIREMTRLHALDWCGLDEFPAVEEAVESGATFDENARLKALHYAGATGLWTLADDSGLVVDALGGAPGVHSARYAGEPRSDLANNRKLVAALADVPERERTARFVCAMALARPGEVLLESSGSVEGRLVDEPRGANGFGYDPHFLVPALGRTAAELSSEEKHTISHRGTALRAMLPRIVALLAQRRGLSAE
ncbi:MAG: dITP/XTP pyrophosphatase [Phycisphaerae bacterium]|nr:dITP/XTP pyrophosphatase [Phycisphaerae bacterium]